MFSLKAFIFSFKDTENALPLLSEPIIHDVTFIRLNVGAIRLWLHMQDSNVFRLCADEISFVLNDLADEIHSERIIIKIPGLNMACMDLEKHGAPATKGYLDTEVSVAVLTKKIFAASDRQLQQKHIRESDHRTGRANFLLADEENDSISSSSTDEPIPASMALPGLPPPLYGKLQPPKTN